MSQRGVVTTLTQWVLAHRKVAPALVALLGRWNWWLPATVQRPPARARHSRSRTA
jgi:uncharacterized membrane protein YdfJ with MMPL/SSD domain